GKEKEIGKFAGGGAIPRGARRVEMSTDGVGTKILLLALMDELYVAGQDAAAMGVVDVYAAGSMPLYMTDTFKAAKLQPDFHISAIEGVIDWCQKAGCILVGGETAELPGMFAHEWIVDLGCHGRWFSEYRAVLCAR
ncbi:MAG: phosphoribosylformylglycinamidine cyclo-ligase, partial [Parcubacteria group bacterium Greene0714_36]